MTRSTQLAHSEAARRRADSFIRRESEATAILRLPFIIGEPQEPSIGADPQAQAAHRIVQRTWATRLISMLPGREVRSWARSTCKVGVPGTIVLSTGRSDAYVSSVAAIGQGFQAQGVHRIVQRTWATRLISMLPRREVRSWARSTFKVGVPGAIVAGNAQSDVSAPSIAAPPTAMGVLRRLAGPRPMPLLAGNVERFDASGMTGWVFDPLRLGDTIEVSLYIDDRLVACAPAGGAREHIAAYGLGTGHCGFNMLLPKRAYYEGRRAAAFARIGGADVLVGDWTLAEEGGLPTSDRPVVHIDLSDLVKFMSRHKRVSGIQRFQVGTLLGLMSASYEGYELAFCARRDDTRFLQVPRDRLEGLLRRLEAPVGDERSGWATLLDDVRHNRLPQASLRRDDAFLALGAPWSMDNHAEALRSIKAAGLRYFQVLYDIVPIAMPDVVDRHFTPSFVSSTALLLYGADYLFSISSFSKTEMEAAAVKIGIRPPPCAIVRLGDSFAGGDTGAAVGTVGLQTLADHGIDGDFVLCVGTIEPRKNLDFLYAVWQHLLQRPGRNVWQLVLVGRVGWNMETFLHKLLDSDYLGGRIVHIQDASDEFLNALYAGCQFTIFPSLYEGWGLPIIESFAHGKVCVCSSTTAMPEAGQDLAIYIDPRDVEGTVELLQELHANRQLLFTREERIKQDFRPTTWEMAAQDLSTKVATALSAQPLSHERASWALRSNFRYAIGFPDPAEAPADQLQAYVMQAHLSTACDGIYWYELENDRRWACGPVAALRLETEAPARAVILEVTVAEPQVGQLCELYIDDKICGNLILSSAYLVLHVSLERQQAKTSHDLRLVIKAMAQPAGPERRLLSLGLLSLMVYDGDQSAAFGAFLRAERHGRHHDLESLWQNMVELGRSEGVAA